ncbi:MAG: TetR/AcrR family transcriptional regulator [Pseudomonadales bacterium]
MKIVDHDQRRLEVAEAAARIIAEQGMEALTTRRIARELACSLGVLSHYFETKDEIVLAALNWAEQRIEGRFVAAARGAISLDTFKPLVINVLPLDKQAELEWRVRLNLSTYALTHPKVLREQREKLLAGYQFTRDLIERLQAEGQIAKDIDADDVSKNIVDITAGLANNLLILPMKDRKNHVEFIDRYWELLRPAGR